MKGGVTQFTVEKTSTTKNFPHHDLGRRSRKEGGNELIILLLLPSLVFPPFIRHRVFFTPQWVLKQYFLYPSSLSPLLYLFFCNTTKLSKEINRFFSAFTQTLEANVLEHVCGYFPPMLSFVVLLLLRFALRELKNQYYFPVAAALLSCKFYHFPQLQFTIGDQSWALQEEGRGLKEKVTQTHKFSSLKRPLELGFCCHLQDKVKCSYYSIEIQFGVRV